MKNIYLVIALLIVVGFFGASAEAAIGISGQYNLKQNTKFMVHLESDGTYDQDDITMKLMAGLSAVEDIAVLDMIQLEVESRLRNKLKTGEKSFVIQLDRQSIDTLAKQYKLNTTAKKQLIDILG
jgi:hypothetical protein